MSLDDHPTVKAVRRAETGRMQPDRTLNSSELKKICLAAGADDVGFVDMDGTALGDWRDSTLSLFPGARTIIGLVCRLNPENVRCVSRAVSDLEFLQGFDRANSVCRSISDSLARSGIRSVSASAGFPLEMDDWPSGMWRVSHKVVAEAAGLGRMGLHRLVIHPRFGSFVVLGSLLMDARVDTYAAPLDFNPCLDCKLCAAVCPVGAVSADGHFSFSNCLTHNYRDRMGGFSDWVEKVVTSRSARDYRSRVSDPETISVWQSLTYGICNKSSFCMAACPAGEDNIAPFLADRAAYTRAVVKPLQAGRERVYVAPGSDGEAHAAKRFPHKRLTRVGHGLRPATPSGFLQGLPLLFNRGRSQGLEARYHFIFRGLEEVEGTVIIDNGSLEVLPGLEGRADVTVRADGASWLAFLAGEKSLPLALILGRIGVKGSPGLLKRFAACFP